MDIFPRIRTSALVNLTAAILLIFPLHLRREKITIFELIKTLRPSRCETFCIFRGKGIIVVTQRSRYSLGVKRYLV